MFKSVLPLGPRGRATASLEWFRFSLKNAVKDVFNIELSKEVRDSAAGKRPIDSWPCVNTNSLDHWEPMSEDAWKAMLDYAMGDSEWCLKLWDAVS